MVSENLGLDGRENLKHRAAEEFAPRQPSAGVRRPACKFSSPHPFRKGRSRRFRQFIFSDQGSKNGENAVLKTCWHDPGKERHSVMLLGHVAPTCAPRMSS